MKSSILLVFAGCASLAWSQAAKTTPAAQSKPATQTAPAPQSPAPATSPAASSQPRGPEGVAAAEPNKIVAVINGKQISAREAAELLKLIPENQRRSSANLEALLQQVYMLSDLSQQATAQKLDEQQPWKDQLKVARMQILGNAYMSKLAASNTQPAPDAQQYYNTHQDQFDIANVSGIMVAFAPPGTPATAGGVKRTEQEARNKADDLEKKIKGGADVATLARTESDNPQSAANGGKLGPLNPAMPNLPSDVKDVVFNKLQPGQVSEPIRLQNAFYILKLDSRTKEPFEQARPQIEQTLAAEKSQALMKQETDKYKIQVQDPAFFGTGAAKPPSLARSPAAPAASSSAAKSSSAPVKPPAQH
ncbi:MAG: peptidylprolyl isomerase [Acidobacteriaceae bacterium]|nr:peptidylprolyl isomerase [Acidobacteriaceae bacterium]